MKGWAESFTMPGAPEFVQIKPSKSLKSFSKTVAPTALREYHASTEGISFVLLYSAFPKPIRSLIFWQTIPGLRPRLLQLIGFRSGAYYGQSSSRWGPKFPGQKATSLLCRTFVVVWCFLSFLPMAVRSYALVCAIQLLTKHCNLSRLSSSIRGDPVGLANFP